MKPTNSAISARAAILIAAGITGIIFQYSRSSSAKEHDQQDLAERRRIGQAYAQLPLRFEANSGQAPAPVKFIARGAGYALLLTPEKAVLQTRDANLQMQLLAANRAPKLTGLEEQTGKTNYIVGRERIAGIKSFGKVKYENVWNDIDLIFYGAQQQLEYDFRLAPGADPKRIRLAFNGAERLNIDEQGALIVRVGDAEVRWLKPIAFQQVHGERREVACGYRIKNKNQIEFQLGRYDRTLPLVIDPALVYSTILGGLFEDYAYGVAVDAQGNAYIAGATNSPDFFTVNPAQASIGSRNRTDAFVLKIAPGGSNLIYATFLGGGGGDAAYAIAVEPSGAAVIAGETDSIDFPKPAGAPTQNPGGGVDAFIAKLDATGSQLISSALLGGNYDDRAHGLALDSAGDVYLTGQTDSTNFPTTGPPRANNTTPFFKTTDAAANWSAGGDGLPNAPVQSIAISPTNTIFAATTAGLFKSTDGGSHWSFNGPLPSVSGTQPIVAAVAFDPKTPAIMYLGTSSGVYKSFNSGAAFQFRSIGLPSGAVLTLLVDPVNTATLYAGTSNGVYKSVNGGESWLSANTVSGDSLFSTTIRSLVLDAGNPATIYAGTSRGVYKTVNSAGVWTAANTGLGTGSSIPPITALAMDPTAPLTLYAGANTTNAALFKTTNGGASWQASDAGLSTMVGGLLTRLAPVSFAIHPTAPATLYAGTPLGVFKSIDAGGVWSLASNGLIARNVTSLAIDPADVNTIYAGTVAGSDAFAAKLSGSDFTLLYSLYLGGDQSEIGRAIAVDAAGAAWVTGQTGSTNFPTVNPLQARLNGVSDAFVAKINGAGTALVFSTFLGGVAAEVGYAIALDAAGAPLVGGATGSNNFPTVDAFKGTYGGGANDGFIIRYKADGSAIEYSTYFGGQNDDQIRALTIGQGGSVWVTGSTNSSNFPAVNSLKPFESDDAFAARFNAAGKQLLFSTFLGGPYGPDIGRAIAADAMSNVYVAGVSYSFDFPQVNPVPATNSTPNGFALKLGSAADLAVTIAAAPEPVLAGAPLTYTITITNAGDLPVTGVKLSDSLPPGTTLVSATPSAGACAGTVEVVCNLGDLSEGASAQATIILNSPITGTTMSNTVRVSGNEPEPKTVNNTATATSQIQSADLVLTNTATHLQIAPGGKLSWATTIRNLSRVKIGGLILNDVLPPDATFVSCTTTAGSCGGTGNNRTATIPSLDSESSVTVIWTAIVNGAVAPGTILTNTATLDPVSFDPNPDNNRASATTTVTPAPPTDVGNGWIAYGYTGVNLIRPDGTGKFTLVSGTNPEWSPDGMKLAYELPYRSSATINADGGGGRTLTTDGSAPTWSPDGTRIAFHRFQKGVIIADADGTNDRVITTSFSDQIDPEMKWSPDGTKLVYSNDSIHVFNLDGSGVKRITTPPSQARDVYPNWSPDGAKIIFGRSQSGFTGDFYTINPDGTELSRLGAAAGRYPTYSPDGTKLAYAASNGRLVVSNADGTSPVTIVADSDNNVIRGISWQRASAAQPKRLVVSGSVGIRSSTTIELSGARTGSISSDSEGRFAIGNLLEGDSLTIKPVSNFYRFSPPSRTYNNLTGDQPNANFEAVRITTTIHGRITDASGAPVGGVTVSVGSEARTETDANGDYRFVDLSGGSSYTVTPLSYRGNDLFEPRSVSFPASEGDKTADFKGVREKLSISGEVADPGGAPIPPTLITITGGGFAVMAGTDGQGRFSVPDLTGGYIYTVTAANPGIVISPATRRVLLGKNLDLRFYARVNPLTAASAASSSSPGVTVGGIVALYGQGLAATTKAATGTPLPFEIDGVAVTFSNRNISSQRLPLFFISPGQINAVIPSPGFSLDSSSIVGEALIEVRQGTRLVAVNSVQIERVAPSVFTADSTGGGLAAAVVLRVKADGSQVFEPVYRIDAQSGRIVPVPIDVSNPAEQVYAILLGMGIRHRIDPASVRVKIGGEDAGVSFAGPHPSLLAVDQVNVLIPRSLAGKGDVDVVLSVEGKTANTVKLSVK